MKIPIVSVKDLNVRLGFLEPLNYPILSLEKSLVDWKMELDDAPIFRYIYHNFRPVRHLEFGTWQGSGVLYCLEECDASVWTINLLHGEKLPDGTQAYHVILIDDLSLISRIRRKITSIIFSQIKSTKQSKQKILYSSDSFGFIGRYYLEAGLGYRVCQVYSDSRQWDIHNYPPGFFDTVLIDGGHSEDVVMNDTQKACQLVRSGGLIMWHDFCPLKEVQNHCSSTRGVSRAVEANWDYLCKQMKDIFWINPSWILLGIKR